MVSAKCAKILLVEDEIPLAENMQILLGLHGYEVVWACNASEALGSLKSEEIDIILLDLRLGQESGVSAMNQALDCSLYLPPIIIVSAEPDHVIAEAAKIVGAIAALRKPCGVLRLKAAIQSGLR